MGYFLGIDLGTTYTAAAIYRNNRASIFSLGGRSASIPSVVLLREDETVLTGDAAVRRAITEPERVAREFKRRLGDTTPIIVGGSPYSAEALMARLLKSVLEEVEKREGEKPERVAISHPANWGMFKIDLLKQTVRLAGLDVDSVVFLTEPEAAVLSYASQERVEAGEVIAVYDLGGGTFDAAVLRRTGDGFEIIGKPEGIERLGGIDFDAAVFAHVSRSLDGALQQLDPEDPAAQAAMTRLRQDCVDAKEALSADTDATIPVLLPTLQTDVRITRREFESLIRPSLVDSIEAMRRALASAGVTAEEVSRVLLVGGSSRTPLIAQLVSSELGRPVAVDAHPKHAIALGAAHAATGNVLGSAASAAAGSKVESPPMPAAAPPMPTGEVPVTPSTPAASAPPTPAAAQVTPPTPAAAPPTPSTPAPSTPSVPLFQDPPPQVDVGVPVVPSNAPTSAPSRQDPPPRLVESAQTPANQAPNRQGPSGQAPQNFNGAPGAAAPGTPVATGSGVSAKSRLPLIGALVGLVVALGVGGFVLFGGGDDGGDDTATDVTTTTVADDAGEDETDDTTSTTQATTTTAAPVELTSEEGETLIKALAAETDAVDFFVGFVQGTAVVNGFVVTEAEKSSLETAIQDIDGVEVVVNNIVAAPTDEWCTQEIMANERWACITGARVENGEVIAEFEFSNGGTDFSVGSGFHLHVYGSNVDALNAGAAGDASIGGGTWQVWDIVPEYRSTPGSVFVNGVVPEKLCVRIATPRHTLESLTSGNCFPIENLDS